MNDITVWSYNEQGNRSGVCGPDPVTQAVRNLHRCGHVVTTDNETWHRSWNHTVIGVGMGHDDAEFAESGRSMAAYYENGDAVHGRWWEDRRVGAKYHGLDGEAQDVL